MVRLADTRLSMQLFNAFSSLVFLAARMNMNKNEPEQKE
jgi:hypothetical protein